MEEKKEEAVLMTEFAFEGGHREGPDFLQHYDDRQKGLPRVNASLSTGCQPDGKSWGPVLPLPDASAPEHCPLEPTDAKVFRMDSHGVARPSTGLMGEIPLVYMVGLWGIMPEEERTLAEARLKDLLRDRWGGGRYRILSVDSDRDFVTTVSGPSIVPAQGEAESEKPRVKIKDTVWLELSRGGPYKVVGKYEHPLGASVPAHHPHDAPNTFETVRVIEGLWLCQDVKGVVHILAEGSLTTTPPASRFSKISQFGTWCWSKREVVLWISLAGTIAALAL